MIFKDKYLKKIINIILFYTSKGYKILGSTSFFTNQEIEDILKLAFPKDKSTILEEQELIRITGDIKFENELTFDKLLNRLYNQNNNIEKDYFLFLVKDSKYIFISLIGNEFTFIDFNRNFEKRKEKTEIKSEEKQAPRVKKEEKPSFLDKIISIDMIVFSVYAVVSFLEIFLLEKSFNEASVVCNFLWVTFLVIYALSYKKMKFRYLFLNGVLGYIVKTLALTVIFHSMDVTSNSKVVGQILFAQILTAFFYATFFGSIFNYQKLKENKVSTEK